MKLSRIDALDLRSDKAVEQEREQLRLDVRGWWTDWDAIEWNFA